MGILLMILMVLTIAIVRPFHTIVAMIHRCDDLLRSSRLLVSGSSTRMVGRYLNDEMCDVSSSLLDEHSGFKLREFRTKNVSVS
jgi:hypothetical protein